MKRKLKNILHNSIALLTLGVMAVSCQDDMPIPDYTVSGEDVRLTVNLSMPQMDIKTRAALDEPSLNQVQSLWIRTYSSVTGNPTSDWIEVNNDLPSTDSEVPHTVTIDTKSGPSYIVGVANVDNQGVTEDNLTPRPLRELLAEANTWPDFLKIAVCTPSDQSALNAPMIPLPMAGCYTNLVAGGDHNTLPHRIEDWQTENFESYFIPASSSGEISLRDGAIHLRRLVSHINFNLYAGDKVKITPTSYRVFNAPAYSWLYERSATGGMTANFGDICTEANQGDYYKSPAQFSQSNINSVTENNVTTYKFDYWQAENKHNAITDLGKDYSLRDKENKTSNLPEGQEPPKNDQYQENSGIFTNLCGASWTPNNMASYVLITCTVEYKDNLKVDENGVLSDNGSTVSRSGVGYYLIHLGYMDNNANDFNCYRNTDYTYNVTVEGLNQIRVEAFHGEEYPGVEGQVADVENSPYVLDCHYGSFNIKLTDDDLRAWDNTTKKGFGFIITTYDNGVEHTFDESDFVNKNPNDLTDDEKKYLNWVELMPTTDESIRAIYKPRSEDGTGPTFNLLDASKGILNDSQKKSTSGWYTVFVNEYSYEAKDADESQYVNGKPLWTTYVNQNPRRFYIRVTRGISADGNCIYSRSKYAGVQQSMMSYYSSDQFSEGSGNRQAGSAVGIERTNESFGLNLRRSYGLNTNSTNGSNSITFSDENGRYNTYLWINSKGSKWENVMQRTKYAKIPEGNTGIAGGAEYSVAKLMGYDGGWTTQTWVNSYRYQRASQYDPQPNATTGLAADNDGNYYIEAINACMNRNRDNNGNGEIDLDEIRWYVPAMGKYLRLLIGNASLENPLMEYNKISQLSPGNGDKYGEYNNGPVGRYMYFASDGRVLWAMEGFSSSNWCQWGYNSPTYPWQVRCVRSLGVNLKKNTSGAIPSSDPIVPAYAFRQRNNDRQKGGTVSMSYYALPSKRVNKLTANGTSSGQMPCHVISDRKYNSLYYNFEISEGQYEEININNGVSDTLRYDIISTSITDFTINSLSTYRSWINGKNPCSVLNTATSTGWRVPNIKEVAIMRNLGLLKGLLRRVGDDYASKFLLSSTFSTFNSSGSNTNGLPADNLTNPLLISRHDGLTQMHSGFNDTWYIRCVRDIDY